MDEYFGDIPIGQLTQGYYARVAVYECKKCGALVRDESRDTHTAEHKTMEQLLALAHQLTDTMRAIHTAVSRTHHL